MVALGCMWVTAIPGVRGSDHLPERLRDDYEKTIYKEAA